MAYRIIVYQATNIVNGKRYIGITRRGLAIRRKRHFHTAISGGGAVIGAAIRKHGKEAFDFRVLIACPDFDYASAMEMALISLYKPEYNLTAGGGGVLAYKMPEEAKLKISKALKGIKRQPYPPINEETRERMREARRKYWAKGPKNHRKGCPPPGKPNRKRAVICLTTGERFETIKDAASHFDIWPITVGNICRGKPNAGSILGLKFCYYGETVANGQMDRHNDNQWFV